MLGIFQKGLLAVTLVAAAGCSNTLKTYEGSGKAPSEVAILYPTTRSSAIGIRYLNDERLGIDNEQMAVHVSPGKNKLTLVHFDVPAGRIMSGSGAMYEIPIVLKPGYTYLPWAYESWRSPPPYQACLLAFTHEEFERLYGDDPMKISHIANAEEAKAECGERIDAKEYVRLHGMP